MPRLSGLGAVDEHRRRRCLLRGLAAFLPEQEVDRVCGKPAKLSLVTEGAFKHGQSTRHSDDV